MQRTDLLSLLPLLILAGSAIVVMSSIAWRRHHGLVATLSAIGLTLTVASLVVAAENQGQVTALLRIDGFALFFIGLVCLASLAVVALAHGYFRSRGGQREELYLLLLLATLGSAVLAASTHFASLFLGVELLSVSLYSLIAYTRAQRAAIEAGIKYLILAAASSAFLVFGMALVYAQQGTMDLAALGASLAAEDLLSVAGMGLMVAGVGFKLAVVPFHMWTPDIYVGAPAPVTAFIASVSKGGMFAFALRFVLEVEPGRVIILALTLMAIASMVVGNLLALLQNNVKRLLAYSSIAHLGYALVALLGSGDLAVEAASYYLAAYIVTILVAFGVVSVLSSAGEEAESLDHYRGLFWQRPWLAALFTASLLSLAGIPLTAGFLGKFYVLLAAVESSAWSLVFTMVLGSVLGLFYYLRLVVVLFSAADGVADGAVQDLSPGWVTLGALGALAVPLLWLGVHPEPLIRLIQSLVGASV